MKELMEDVSKILKFTIKSKRFYLRRVYRLDRVGMRVLGWELNREYLSLQSFFASYSSLRAALQNPL